MDLRKKASELFIDVPLNRGEVSSLITNIFLLIMFISLVRAYFETDTVNQFFETIKNYSTAFAPFAIVAIFSIWQIGVLGLIYFAYIMYTLISGDIYLVNNFILDLVLIYLAGRMTYLSYRFKITSGNIANLKTYLLVSFAIIVGTVITINVITTNSENSIGNNTPPRLETQMQCTKPQRINFPINGVYQSGKSNDSWGYLRVYENGSIISVTSTGTPEEINDWFKIGHPNISQGCYSIHDNNISFVTESSEGKVEYAGEIKENGFELNVHSLINETRHHENYHFISQ